MRNPSHKSLVAISDVDSCSRTTDSKAAFNEQRAANQNCTIGISFGASRELAFRHAKTGELIYVPQKNGMLFYFGRDAMLGMNQLISVEGVEKRDLSPASGVMNLMNDCDSF